MPASRAPALGEPSRGLSRRQPGDGSRWDGALAARRRGGGEASLAGCARQRERPAGILPATAAASCDSRPSRCGDFLLARLSCEHAGISRGRSSVPKAQCVMCRVAGADNARPGVCAWRRSPSLSALLSVFIVHKRPPALRAGPHYGVSLNPHHTGENLDAPPSPAVRRVPRRPGKPRGGGH